MRRKSDSLKLMKNARGPRHKRPGLMGLRAAIDGRVVEMVLSQLTAEQRALLRATAGNPRVDHHLRRLIFTLLTADGALKSESFVKAFRMAKK